MKFLVLQKLYVHFMYFFLTRKDAMLWDTPRMIDHYQQALLRVLLGLFAMAGIEPEGEGITSLPRGVKFAILKVLRRAESATRRLIATKTRGQEIPVYVPPAPRDKPSRKGSGKTRAKRVPQFSLIDPRSYHEELHPHRQPRRAQRKRRSEPRLLFRLAGLDGQPDYEEWSEADPVLSPDDELTAVSLCRRMQALFHALNDLDGQAQRMIREIAKRRAAKPGPGSVPPLRGGNPPGHRKKSIDEVDEILEACHWLATREPEPPERPAPPA